MKKIIILSVIAVFLSVPFLSHAAVPSLEELLYSVIQLQNQLIDQLNAKVSSYEAQITALQNQITGLGAVPVEQAPVQVSQPTQSFGSVSLPEPTKTVSVVSDNCDINKNGRYCTIEVFYFENGKRVNADAVTISSNDNGVFMGYDNPANPNDPLRKKCSGGTFANSDGTQTQGNPISCPTRKSGKDGLPVGYFTYLPEATGTRIITATVNGVTATTTSVGQWIQQ